MNEEEVKTNPSEAENEDSCAENIAAEETVEETAPTDESGTLLEKLNQAEARAQEMETAFLRARADLDNVRKRAIREKEDTIRLANSRIIEDLLPVLDNFSLGLQSVQEQGAEKTITEGFSMVLGQLEGILTQSGLEALNPAGEEFNPAQHEALSQVPSEDIEEGKIVQVVRIGYQLKGQLLRPASVIVSSGTPQS